MRLILSLILVLSLTAVCEAARGGGCSGGNCPYLKAVLAPAAKAIAKAPAAERAAAAPATVKILASVKECLTVGERPKPVGKALRAIRERLGR